MLTGTVLVGFTAHAQQPQRRHRHRQPQARGPSGIAHPRPLPLPPGAFGDLEALFDPGPKPIPGRIARLGGQIGQDQPRVCMPRIPARQQRALQLPPAPFKGRAAPAPLRADLRNQTRQGTIQRRPLRPKRAAVVDP